MKKFTGVVVAAGLGVFALVGCSTPEVIEHSEKEPAVVEEITEVAPPETTEVAPPETNEGRPDTLEGIICTMFDVHNVQSAWEIIYLTGIDSGLEGTEVVDATQRALDTECPEHIDAVIEGLRQE